MHLVKIGIEDSGRFAPMKSLDNQISLTKFRLAERQRHVTQIEGMIAELAGRCSDLERELDLEHSRTKIADPRHFAYSPLAKSIVQRRENLESSLQGLHFQLKAAQNAASETLDGLTELQHRKEREQPEEQPNRSIDLPTGAIFQFT